MKNTTYKKNKNLRYRLFSYMFLGILSAFFLTGCQKASDDEPLATKADIAFDTVIQVSVYQNASDYKITKNEAESLIQGIMEQCLYYDNLFSKTKQNSDIYHINHANGKAVTVSEETFYLIEESLLYSEKTNGSIDITISKVKDLWDFSSQNEQADESFIPSDDTIQAALKHVNYQNIILDKTSHTVTLTDPEAEIDLGFIAKGYIADKIKEYLVANHIENAIINLGGNVLTIGSKPSKTPFIVGIKKPFTQEQYMEKVSVTNQSVVTSGIYERYFKVDSVLYHHIINPKTGYPVSTDLLSATIIADSSMQADALSTTCILLGTEKAKKLIENQPNVRAIFITKDYEIIRVD